MARTSWAFEELCGGKIGDRCWLGAWLAVVSQRQTQYPVALAAGKSPRDVAIVQQSNRVARIFFRVEPKPRSPDPLSYNVALQPRVPCARVAVIVPPLVGCEPVADSVTPHLIIAAAYRRVGDELEPEDTTSLRCLTD